MPPLSISSSSHPDQTLYYNDDSPGLSLAWDQAFMGRQGYYWGVNTTPVSYTHLTLPTSDLV